MSALSPSVPATLLPARKQPMRVIVEAVWDAIAAASGRTALDYVQIPDNITEVDRRTRRLVRQAQVSAW